eukprot:gene6457-158_t
MRFSSLVNGPEVRPNLATGDHDAEARVGSSRARGGGVDLAGFVDGVRRDEVVGGDVGTLASLAAELADVKKTMAASTVPGAHQAGTTPAGGAAVGPDGGGLGGRLLGLLEAEPEGLTWRPRCAPSAARRVPSIVQLRVGDAKYLQRRHLVRLSPNHLMLRLSHMKNNSDPGRQAQDVPGRCPRGRLAPPALPADPDDRVCTFPGRVGPRLAPLSASWAPTAMPMRSLALILRVAGLANVSVVWIDNVRIVAPDDATLKERLARFHAAATLVGLTYTEDERGQEVDFLGAHLYLHWGTGLFNFTERFQDKVAATALSLGTDLSVDDLQYISGLANWVCRLARIPLVRVAPLLQALGTASIGPDVGGPASFNLFTDASGVRVACARVRAIEILDFSDVSLPIGIDSMVVVAGYSRSSYDLCGTLEKIVDLCEERDIRLLPYSGSRPT